MMEDSKSMLIQPKAPLPEMELTVQDLSRSGAGVCREESGRVIFVPFTLPGDRVRVRLVTESKRYAEAKVLDWIERSPQRQKPPCPVFERCGGCQWQHVPYSIQWETKRRGSEHALSRVGLAPLTAQWEERPADQIWEYRNRIQLRGDGQNIGYFAPKSHSIIPISKCWIARPEVNAEIEGTRVEGARRLAEGGSFEQYKVEVEVLPNGVVRKTWDSPHGAAGFRQVHDEQNARLQSLVADWLKGSGHLLDLFGGAGNLSMGIADRFQSVECVDFGSPAKSPPAGTPTHYRFHKGAVLPWLRREKQRLMAQSHRISVIVDPPRTGLGAGNPEDAPALIGILTDLPVDEVIAVGCDADSWAHDLAKFSKNGWVLEKAGVLDLFPQTPHVESLARLVRVTR